jgi:DNA-binding NarL/FixJ family response regulator
LLVGRALAAGSERAAAIAELETARDQLASRRANCFGDQAERELRRLGRAGARRSADPAHPLGLTEREIEVIDRVAAGRTNREIADELVLSVRTVDRHVARIFEKLGVKSRVAAVGVYERARGR